MRHSILHFVHRWTPFGKRGNYAAVITIFAALVSLASYLAFGSPPGIASGDALQGPSAQVTATPTTVTGLYRNTTEGFSFTLPTGWMGETGEKPVVLSAQDNQTTPNLILDVWVFRTSQPETPGEWLSLQIEGFAGDSGIISPGMSVAIPEGGSVDQQMVDYTTVNGAPIREVWTAYSRGTQMVMVRVIMLQSNYTPSISLISTITNSFAFEVPAPFGASQSDSLFLSQGNILTIDPALYRGSADGIVGALFGSLVKLNRELEVEGEIATDWNVDASGTVYTFHIHPQAKFHDGRPITASDVKYSWERAASPELDSPTVRTYLGDIVGVQEVVDGDATEISGLQVVDSLTLKVTIDSPKTYFIQKLTYPTSYIVDQQAVETGGEDWTQAPNGSGRYWLKVWNENDLLILERVDDHHLGTPGLKNIVYRILAGRPMSMYEEGEIDVTGIGGADIERALDPGNSLNLDVYDGVGMCTTYLYFNPNMAPFDDINVRKAFAMALDIDRYIEVSLKGHSNRASSVLPPGMPGHMPDLFNVDYDPVAARTLLEQSEHFTSGFFSEPLISYSGNNTFNWMWSQNLDLDFIRVSLPDPDDSEKRRDDGEFSFGSSGWCADYPDPQNFLEILMHSDSDENSIGYSNPVVDALLEQAASEPDEETRFNLYLQAEQQVMDDWVFIPLTHPQYRLLVKPYVKNYELTPIGIQLFHELEIQR